MKIVLTFASGIKNKKMIRLKEEYRAAVEKDQELIGKIAAITNKKVNTVVGWLSDNDVTLTRADVLYVIQHKLCVDDVRDLTELIDKTEKVK